MNIACVDVFALQRVPPGQDWKAISHVLAFSALFCSCVTHSPSSAYQESKGLFLPKQAHQSNGVSLEEVKKG